MHDKDRNVSRKNKFALPAEAGIGLLEILVSILLVAVAAGGIASGQITALKVEKLTQIHLAASTIASGKVEELSAVDILDLDASYDENNVPVIFPGISFPFLRSVAVTVNADDSRTINVTVTSSNTALPTTVNFTTRFALWE